MIKLFIDGSEVHLAADISLEFYDRNPFFTSEGQHTLDIDISLDDPRNAVIYNAIHRIDIAKHPQNRSAILYCEKGVIIKGTEIILEISDRNVKIQIAAGNSELNFLTGSDKYIRDLDLGGIDELSESIAQDSLYASYPTFDFVCCPVVAKAKLFGQGVNEIAASSDVYNEINETEGATSVTIKKGTTLCPQPYLAAIVRRVITALGYNIASNILGSHKELSKLIFVHGYKTLKYNEMVENWKVSDFISEVEKLCGVRFLVDNNTKNVEVQTLRSYYSATAVEIVNSADIVGNVDKKYDQDPPDDITYHNVSYKFPNTPIYKRYALDADFAQKIEYVKCPHKQAKYDMYYFELWDVWSHILGGDPVFDKRGAPPQKVVDSYHSMTAYYNRGFFLNGADTSNIQAVGFEFPFAVWSVDSDFTNLAMINQFGPRVDESNTDKTELKIVPIENVFSQLRNYYSYPMPIVENGDGDVGTVVDENEGKGVAERLFSDTSEASAKDNMYVGFYMGVSKFEVIGEIRDNHYPVVPVTINSRLQVRTRRDAAHSYPFWEHQTVRIVKADGNYDLSINSSTGMYNTYWSTNVDVDLTTVYTIRFRTVQRRDVRRIFNIANQKFYCQQLKYEVVDGELSDVVEGTFYPLK